MSDQHIVVLISADYEWQAVKEILSPTHLGKTLPGETFNHRGLIYFHGGWGKISAAATTQFVIDRFKPRLLINLGTCGGFEGHIERGTVILVTKTVVYDIREQMADAENAIASYSTDLDLSWIKDEMLQNASLGPSHFVRAGLVSADRDILPEDISQLIIKYGAVAADWESGAISWVAKRNEVRCLILRGVTDLVGKDGGEAYGNIEVFHKKTNLIMRTLIDQLPLLLASLE